MRQPSLLEKKALISHILHSPEFHESKRYQELLQYLVDKSAKVDSLKETEIAQEVFGKDSRFDPSTDPLVRSYVSNLRKKLEHYYFTTDHQFEFKLEIPKGQYLVKYASLSPKTFSKKAQTYLPVAYLVVIVILTAFILFHEFGHRLSPSTIPRIAAANAFWSEFLDHSSHSTMIVIGDFLVLSEKGKTEGRTFLRDPKINSERELRDLARLVPKPYGNYQISDVSYIGAGTAIGLAEVIRAVGGSSKAIDVKLSSQLKWDDFDNHNIVYIGTLKTLDKLDTLFSRTNLKFNLNPNTLEISDARGDSTLAFDLDWQGGSYQKDYSIILKLLGSKNNSIVFLTGFSEVGVMESVKASTDPALLSRISMFSNTAISSEPFYCEIVSEVEGVRYTVFRSEIKYFSLLNQPLLDQRRVLKRN